MNSPKNSSTATHINQFQKAVLNWLEKLHKNTRRRVKTIDIALYVPKHERQIRYALVALEAAGLAQRVGQRGGWLPVAQNEAVGLYTKPTAGQFPSARPTYS
ncbi:MAG: hypothetical protein MUF38_14845, partial [Anaerolineae bacterium]|nr:hypothetical protein [Anaerolineae bacterium]